MVVSNANLTCHRSGCITLCMSAYQAGGLLDPYGGVNLLFGTGLKERRANPVERMPG